MSRHRFLHLRHWLHQHLPKPERLFAHRWLQPLAPLLSHPGYWALNRRKVARAVAVGLFCGLLPGPTQMLGAALVALVWRVNVPVAMLVTLYTNPLTYIPLYLLAYELGLRLLGRHNGVTIAPPADWSASAWLHWMGELGTPLLIGVPALGLLLGVLGYTLVMLGWRWLLLSARKQGRHVRGSHRKNP